MSPENPERPSSGTRRAIRQTKANLRENLLISTQPETWAAMETILKLRLPNYNQLAGTGGWLIRDWFETRLNSSFLDGKQKEEAVKQFQNRHPKEALFAVKDALAVITQTIR